MTSRHALLNLLVLIFFFDTAYTQIFYNKMELSESSATDSVSFNINSIDIAGNFKTKEYIILRELHFQKDETVTLKEIFLAQKRVLNLFLFNRVIFDIIGEGADAILLITVAEQWYFFPLPIFYLNERSWHKISYGAKLLYYNFMGRNMLLNFTTAFGYNPEIKLCYRNPWFGGKLKLMTNIVFFKSRVRSKNLEFEQIDDKRIGFNWMLGRRFGHFLYLYFNVKYMELQHPDLTFSPTGNDKLPSLTLNLSFDNRDLKEYPHDGYRILIWGKQVKHKHPINYYRYGYDFRRYFPVTTYSTLAVRTSANLSHGRIPLYDRVFLGYGERVRGQFHKKREGENVLVGGIEYRFPLKKIKYFDLSELAPPGFEDYYRNLKFGMSAGIFYDYGAIWYQDDVLSKKHYHYGFGMGLHFHLPYVDLFRFEIGFDKDFNTQFIGEVEVAF